MKVHFILGPVSLMDNKNKPVKRGKSILLVDTLRRRRGTNTEFYYITELLDPLRLNTRSTNVVK